MGYYYALVIHIIMAILELEPEHGVDVTAVIPSATAELIRQSTIIFALVPYCLDHGAGAKSRTFLMFPVDACWEACEILDERLDNFDMQKVKTWFRNVGKRMSFGDLPPFREPWLE